MMDPDFDTEEHVVISDVELKRVHDEIDRLRADLAAVLEDRARFPDKPDGIGRMIEAHIGNLKHGKDEANRHAVEAMNRSSYEIERLLTALRRIVSLGRKNVAAQAQEIARQVLG